MKTTIAAVRTLTLAALAASVILAPSRPALAQGKDYVAEVNNTVAQTGRTKEASEVLFPKVAAMDPIPGEYLAPRTASLMTPKSDGWSAAAAWAAAPNQQAVLEALKTITNPSERFVLGFPYGRSHVPAEWVEAGLFVDLGAPELLAAANDNMDYLFAMSDVATLCTIEAERRAAAGEGKAALAPLVSWLRLGRMVADRQFFLEKQWGMQAMRDAAERILDIAFQHPDVFSAQDIADAITELDLRALAPERITFPDGERQAALQLLDLSMSDQGSPSETGFASTLGLLDASPNALGAFGTAAYWAKQRESHAGRFDTEDQIEYIFGDWNQRWQINDIFDPIWFQPTDYFKMDRARFALVERAVGTGVVSIEALFPLRTSLMVELTGARSALGVVGFRAKQKVWPPTLAAVQPAFVQRLDFDPWNWNEQARQRGIFQFFVPMRDQKVGPREQPAPHRMRVRFNTTEQSAASQAAADELAQRMPQEMREQMRRAFTDGLPATLTDENGRVDAEKFKELAVNNINNTPGLSPEQKQTVIGAVRSLNQAQLDQLFALLRAAVGMEGETEAFSAELRDDRFVLYSIGPDRKPDFARLVGQGGEDIIIWPPILSLERMFRAAGGNPESE